MWASFGDFVAHLVVLGSYTALEFLFSASLRANTLSQLSFSFSRVSTVRLQSLTRRATFAAVAFHLLLLWFRSCETGAGLFHKQSLFRPASSASLEHAPLLLLNSLQHNPFLRWRAHSKVLVKRLLFRRSVLWFWLRSLLASLSFLSLARGLGSFLFLPQSLIDCFGLVRWQLVASADGSTCVPVG